MTLSAVCVRQDTYINTKERRGKMTNIEIFAKRVRDTREAIPATLEEIALFSGLTPERVATIESGKDKSVNALEINRLAFALGTNFQALMFGKVGA
jgi:transcriptional regulator with XRE-family HTH domain